MKHCDENCLSCSFDKCLDEMTDRERRAALGKDYAGRGKKKQSAIEEAEVVTIDDPAEKERLKKELEKREKNRKYQAEYYQRNKEKLNAGRNERRKATAKKKDLPKKSFTDVAEELKELEEMKKTITTTDDAAKVVTTEMETTEIVVPEAADQKEELVTVQLTKMEAANICDVIVGYIQDNTRDELDMEYLCFMCDLWRKFKQ